MSGNILGPRYFYSDLSHMSAKMIIVFSGNEDNALRIAELFYRSIYYLSGIIYNKQLAAFLELGNRTKR